jgi:hypothetical protein
MGSKVLEVLGHPCNAWRREKNNSHLREEETQKQNWCGSNNKQQLKTTIHREPSNRPPPSFIYERSPLRTAAATRPTSSADSADWFCGGAAVVSCSRTEKILLLLLLYIRSLYPAYNMPDHVYLLGAIRGACLPTAVSVL